MADDDILKNLGEDELRAKREEARLFLSGNAKPKKEEKEAAEVVKNPLPPPKIGATEQEILSTLSEEVLKKKRLEAKYALGDIPRRPLTKTSELKLKKNIKELEANTVKRSEQYKKQLASRGITKDTVQKSASPVLKSGVIPAMEIPQGLDEALSITNSEPEKPNGPEPELDSNKDVLEMLRTQRKDIEKAIKSKKITLSEIAIKEQERRRTLEQSGYLNKTSRWQSIVLVLSIILIFTGTTVILYYAFFKEDPVIIPVPPDDKTYIITPDTNYRLDVEGMTNEEIRNRFNEIILSGEVTNKKIQNVSFIKKQEPEEIKLVSKEVLPLMDIVPPERLTRSLDDNFMIGIYAGRANEGFLIFKIASFENVFASMLEWEDNSLPELYEKLTVRKLDGTEKTLEWRDAFVRNIDIRVLIDSSEDIFLIYSFLDKETLLITTSKDAFLEVSGRYYTPERVLR